MIQPKLELELKFKFKLEVKSGVDSTLYLWMSFTQVTSFCRVKLVCCVNGLSLILSCVYTDSCEHDCAVVLRDFDRKIPIYAAA